MSLDVLKELEEELRESLRKRFSGMSEAVFKKVRVWVDEKRDGCLSTNAAFLVSKATGKPLPEVALTVGAGWLADDPKLGRVECYYGNGVVVKISQG